MLRSAPFLACLAAVAALTACRDDRTRMIIEPPPPPPPTCGDGIIQDGEDCDGSEAGTGTCQSLGFDTGRVVCNAQCHYDTALCVKRCGNGVLDLGETCDGKLGVPSCDTWGANVCTSSCAVDTLHCVSPAFETAPELDLSKGGPAVVGDFNPKGPGDLLVAVPALGRVELVPWNMALGFDGVSSRKLSFQRSPVRAETLDLDGDGNLDVVTVNADGTFDLLVNTGASYALTPLDGGCPGATFLPQDGVVRRSAVAVGCNGFAIIAQNGGSVTATPQATAVARVDGEVWWVDSQPVVHSADGGVDTLPSAVTALGGADLDGDGDPDLAGVTATGVEVFENLGLGFASRVTFTAASASDLRVFDLDGDGLADLVFLSGVDLVVRRNRGNFVFTETKVTGVGAGTRLSVALGDVDGDQDTDVAITLSTGGDTTKTRVVRNRTR
ncbi:MAG: VCBS repeat-containing protein [Myxococcaceae bacterium]